MQAPHPPLRDYYVYEAERAAGYDSCLTELPAIMTGSCGSWHSVRDPATAEGRCSGQGSLPGMRVLDIGVGTGLRARQAARLVGASGRVTEIDPSSGMIQRKTG